MPLMAKFTDSEVSRQVADLSVGCEAVYTQQALADRLASAGSEGRQLRIKLGLDPTAPDIHLGHTVVLRKIRQFQDLGHKAIIVIGDYTARVGDPSGVNKTRPVLSPEQIEQNATTYIAQAGKVIDTSDERLEIRRNGEWLAKLNLADLLKLGSQITVARMMERDTFEKRFKAEIPIGVHEFLYPLMQGYDSVAISADIELGGTDQTFNNLAGRTIQKAYGQPSQIVMVLPILVGLDGTEKMSKSKGNYIALTDEPNDMFGKVMSIPDSLMRNYFTLLTDAPGKQVDELLDGDKTHPRQAKATLGKSIVQTYYGQAAAEAAAAEFDRVFSEQNTPTDMPEIVVSGKSINIVQLVRQAGFAKSNGEARRLVQQNAVSIDEKKVKDIEQEVSPANGSVLRVGKRRFGKIVVQ